MHIETEATQHLQRAAAAARAASHVLARTPDAERNAALACDGGSAARRITPTSSPPTPPTSPPARGTAAFRDRLTLTEARIEAMATGLEDVAPCPIRSAARWPTGRGRTACASSASPRRSA